METHLENSSGQVRNGRQKNGLRSTTAESNDMESLTDTLSKTHIDSEPSDHANSSTVDSSSQNAVLSQLLPTQTTSSPPVNSFTSVLAPTSSDFLDQFLRDLETAKLAAGYDESRKILSNDPLFSKSWAFAEKWGIHKQGVINHIKLAGGNMELPAILLLNPEPLHEVRSYDLETTMKECSTLEWIGSTIEEIGTVGGILCLSLEDISILDIFPLLSNPKLRRIGNGDARNARKEAVEITCEMLKTWKPKVIISCQAQSGKEKWKVDHELCEKLCSSVEGAKEGYKSGSKSVKSIELNGHMIQVVQGFHPRYFLGRFESEVENNGKLLENIFHKLFRPYALRNFDIFHADKIFSAIWEFHQSQQAILAAMSHIPKAQMQMSVPQAVLQFIRMLLSFLLKQLEQTLEAMSQARREVQMQVPLIQALLPRVKEYLETSLEEVEPMLAATETSETLGGLESLLEEVKRMLAATETSENLGGLDIEKELKTRLLLSS